METIDESFKSQLGMAKQKWNSLKDNSTGTNPNTFLKFSGQNSRKKDVQALTVVDNKQQNFITKFYLKQKRNAMIASLNMPGTLERETSNLMQDFTSRIENKLASLEEAHLKQLVQKRRQIQAKYGKFRFIREDQLTAPF